MPNHKAPRARAKYRARDPAVPPPRRAPWLSLHGTAGVSEAEARLATRLAWGLEALLAAALFWMALGPHRIGDCFTESDFYGSYAEGARLIQQGRLIPGRYGVVGPVYEVTLALVGFLFRRDLFVAAEAISIAATVATLHLWFSLLRRRADARIALFGVLFLVTNPVLFLFGYSASTDALALALQSGALLLLLSGTRDRAAWGAGILSALAVLTRYSAVYLFPAGLAAMLAGGALHERRGRAALLFTLGFLAPVGAWALFAMSSGGLSFQLHHNVAYEVFARAKGIPWDEYETTLEPQFKTLADVIARDPGAVFGRVLFNLVDHLRLDAAALLGWPTAIAALLGVVLGLLDGTLRRLWPLWVAGALCYLTLAPVFHSERYALPLLPVYCTLAALACASPRFALVIGREPGRWLKPALAAIPLALSIVQGVRTEVSAMRKLPVEVLECAETLRRLERPDDRVIARKNHLAYYAGVAGLPFPNLQTLPALAEYAHRHEARWLYVSWVEAELRPHFWYLLDTAGVVPGLTPRRVTRPNPAVLYEIGPGFGRVPAWFGNDTLVGLYNTRARALVEVKNVKLLYGLALQETRVGRLSDAREHLEQAARLAPDDADIPLALGGVALGLGDAQGAAAAFQRAGALDPSSVEARVGFGWAILLTGDLRGAAREWRPVIDSVNDPAILERMAEVFRRVGDREAEQAALANLRRLRGGP